MPANGQRPSCPLLGVSKAGQKTATDALAAKLDCGRIMQVAFASAPSNIGVFDCEGRVLLANPALQSYFGTDFEEIYGKVVGDIPHHADFSSLQASIQETATKARPTALEIPLEDADGKAEVHIINLVPALSSSGETMYVIGYGRNIANIERLKAAVAEAGEGAGEDLVVARQRRRGIAVERGADGFRDGGHRHVFGMQDAVTILEMIHGRILSAVRLDAGLRRRAAQALSALF